MAAFRDEFVDQPHRKYKFKIGKSFATAQSGFVAGFLVAAVVLIPLSVIVCRYLK